MSSIMNRVFQIKQKATNNRILDKLIFYFERKDLEKLYKLLRVDVVSWNLKKIT